MRTWAWALALCFLVLGASVALAGTGYDSSNDVYLNVKTGTGLTADSSTGQTTFAAQEGVYKTTGTEVNHYYVWVCVDGACYLAIDPIRPQNF